MPDITPPLPDPPASAAKARDLDALRAAVADAATIGTGLWLSYLFVLFYLLIAVGGITPRDLLLQSPIRLPFLSTDLPLLGFFYLGPAIFLVVHAYVLLHFVMLADKVGVFHAELQAQIADEDTRSRIRRQLPSNIFVQYLAGPGEARRGVMGWMLRLIALISLVGAPLALLAFFQVRFLPYHDEAATWWQRIALVADLLLLWTLWPAIAHGNTIAGAWREMGVSKLLVPGVLSAGLLVFAFLLATFPGEWLDAALYGAGADEGVLASPHRTLFQGEVDAASRRPTSLLSNVLVLPGLNTDPGGSATGKPPLSLRLRHLEGAVLIGADLRRVDLTAAKLRAAKLGSADLRGADFGCDLQKLADTADGQGGDNYCAVLDEAQLDQADLSGARLNGAHMRAANLQGAHLDKANLDKAHLQGAELDDASLRGASLYKAEMAGSSLLRAHLHGASLHGAHMAGSVLRMAQLEGATLDEADLSGADLSAAQLAAASLHRTRLIAASLHGAHLSGATLDKTELLAARLDEANLDAASLNGVVVGLAEGDPPPSGKARIVSLQTRPQVYAQQIGAHSLEALVLRDWSVEDYAALLANGFGGETRKRVARLDPSAHIEEDPSVRDGWKRLEDSSLTAEEFGQKLTDVLSRTACAADGAPDVAAAIINRINAREIDAKALAGRLIDDTNCPGAHGLPEQARQELRNLLRDAPD